MSSARFLVAGPSHVFVGFYTPTTTGKSQGIMAGPSLVTTAQGTWEGGANYFGTCEVKPVITQLPKYRPVYNDIAGGADGAIMDQNSAPMMDMVSADINRIAYEVYLRMSNQPRHDNNGLIRGATKLDTGSLLIQGGNCFKLWVYWPFSGSVNIPAVSTLVPGHFWPAVELVMPQTIESGTAVLMARMQFLCHPVYDAATRSFVTSSSEGKFFTGLEELIN